MENCLGCQHVHQKLSEIKSMTKFVWGGGVRKKMFGTWSFNAVWIWHQLWGVLLLFCTTKNKRNNHYNDNDFWNIKSIYFLSSCWNSRKIGFQYTCCAYSDLTSFEQAYFHWKFGFPWNLIYGAHAVYKIWISKVRLSKHKRFAWQPEK